MKNKIALCLIAAALIILALVIPQHIKELNIIKQAISDGTKVTESIRFAGGGAEFLYAISALLIIYGIVMLFRSRQSAKPKADDSPDYSELLKNVENIRKNHPRG